MGDVGRYDFDRDRKTDLCGALRGLLGSLREYFPRNWNSIFRQDALRVLLSERLTPSAGCGEQRSCLLRGIGWRQADALAVLVFTTLVPVKPRADRLKRSIRRTEQGHPRIGVEHRGTRTLQPFRHPDNSDQSIGLRGDLA